MCACSWHTSRYLILARRHVRVQRLRPSREWMSSCV
uniref:Uncharacterized protein n=1 Tax=Arundo donax TaxID=35708 RepID=A0A0A8YKR3_ARUDO